MALLCGPVVRTLSVDQLLEKYDRPVPRYTSFPTAVHFDQVITQETYARLLAGITDKAPLALYLHIPFCRELCYYCGCHTRAVNDARPVQSYLTSLRQEIHHVGQCLTSRPVVSSVHFGGGTPNILEMEDLSALIDDLKTYFHFHDQTEIDIELDPRLLNTAQIQGLAQIGVGRVSLGAQDFNDAVQRAVNRIQPYEKVQDDVQALRAAGISKINLDMMIGLPCQTERHVHLNAERTLDLDPDRMAVFAYAHVPWMKKHQKLLEKYPLPGLHERHRMNTIMADAFTSAGYVPVGIDHFARPDDPLARARDAQNLRRNFQGYVADGSDTLIGFGVSSIGRVGETFIQNIATPRDYQIAVSEARFPIQRGRVLSAEDAQRSHVIEQIMCQFAVACADFDGLSYAEELMMDLLRDGLVERSQDRLEVTALGKPFTRIVASCFDPYYKHNETRHARAV